MKTIAFAVLAFASMLSLVPELVFAQSDTTDLEKRGTDSFKVYNRKRNAHACIMSIVFIVLYPLGAISVHLPIDRIPLLRNTYLRSKITAIHAPIQLIGFVMMIGAMALGIRIAQDLGYFSHVHAHMVIGLLVCIVIIIFQPLLGIIQHQHYKRTGGKSVFAYVHRWVGRGAIILGIINNGLGFQLAANNVEIPSGSLIRNFALVGVLSLVWLGLILYDDCVAKKRQPGDNESQKNKMTDHKEPAMAATHDGV